MSDSSLQSKLLNSDAYTSLSSEQKILHTLQNLKWIAHHSCFYPDLKTEKLREIDVFGSQIWERKLKSGSQFAILNLIVEAKSAKGYHLLFSQLRKSSAFRAVNYEWLGLQDSNERRVAETLAKSALNTEQVAFVLKKYKRSAYPKSTFLIHSLIIEKPPAKIYCSAFRETNIGNVKDLDSSVLWRAAQALFSAVSSLKERRINFHLDELLFDIEMASHLKIDPVSQAIERLDLAVHMLELYHPVVVIDAPLWMVKDGDIIEIPWCRFEQIDTMGRSDWQFDVVQSPHFEAYAQEITRHYEKKFTRVRARRWPDKTWQAKIKSFAEESSE